MKNKQLLLGDEAIALAAIHSGIAGVYAYPGTPSTEITEFIQGNKTAKERGIHSRWCTNEKTAMEAALGVSYVGRRSIVCMKHVGMNVAADAFVNSGITGANGGLLVIAADDPSMHSSQNEQDSRFYGKFSFIPVLEPSNQQEAYDMTRFGLELSEKMKTPVLMRVTTRMAHSRAVVEVDDQIEEHQEIRFPEHPRSWVLLPAISKRRYVEVLANYANLEEMADASPFNALIDGPDHSMGIITCGIAYNYLMENMPQGCRYPVLKITQYPFPKGLIRQLSEQCESILVLEEGQPLLEEYLRGILDNGKRILGRLSGDVPRTGELTADNIKPALGLGEMPSEALPELVTARPPALCQGCGHRDVYTALNQVLAEYPNHRVFSDIGCYTLGALPPFQAIHSTVDMGASITMAKGAADAGLFPAVSVIGDSTFTHSGMTGLLDAVNSNAPITVVISDNLTTGMTGGQDSAGTGKLERICEAIGVEPEHIRVVVPLAKNMPEITAIIREELNYKGVSVIIPRRECIQTFARKAKQRKAESNKK